MSFGDVIVMPLEVAEDPYGDRGDYMRAVARQICKNGRAREFLEKHHDDPANLLLRAIRNELESPATPLISDSLPIKRAIRRVAEMANVEIIIETTTGMELHFCPNWPQAGAYTLGNHHWQTH